MRSKFAHVVRLALRLAFFLTCFGVSAAKVWFTFGPLEGAVLGGAVVCSFCALATYLRLAVAWDDWQPERESMRPPLLR